MKEEQKDKRTRGKRLSSYPVSVQTKTIVNAAEKFDEKDLAKLIGELKSITERAKAKKKSELEKKIQELNEELNGL